MKLVRAALYLGVGLVLLVPTQAYAANTSHVDATGDVVAFTPESDFEDAVPAPERRNGDIRGFYYTHGKRAVIVTIRFVELSKADGLGTVVRLNTDRGRRDIVHVAGLRPMMSSPHRSVRCNIRTSVSYANDRVQLVVPRRCLGNPRWVRAGAGVFTGLETSEDEPLFVDEAYRNGNVTQSNDLRLGGRVLRG